MSVLDRFRLGGRWAPTSGDVAMGAMGEPEDLGPLAVFLASDAARYVTGTALVIDGGYTCL